MPATPTRPGWLRGDAVIGCCPSCGGEAMRVWIVTEPDGRARVQALQCAGCGLSAPMPASGLLRPVRAPAGTAA